MPPTASPGQRSDQGGSVNCRTVSVTLSPARPISVFLKTTRGFPSRVKTLAKQNKATQRNATQHNATQSKEKQSKALAGCKCYSIPNEAEI